MLHGTNTRANGNGLAVTLVSLSPAHAVIRLRPGPRRQRSLARRVCRSGSSRVRAWTICPMITSRDLCRCDRRRALSVRVARAPDAGLRKSRAAVAGVV